MAEDLPELADRIFRSVLAPLVLGGTMEPARPIGARAALALLKAGAVPGDADLAAKVGLARLAQARKLAPVDTLDDPNDATWALAAVLHDLLQVTNPGWIRRTAPRRLLDLATATLAQIPFVSSAHEALARHTWFSRVFEVRRQDTAVSWWTGSREFHGREPPKRLLRWQELRRVSVARADRTLTELLDHGGKAEHAQAFEAALSSFLRATPLTDFATCFRSAPRFQWTPEALAIVRSPVARTLALRAVSYASVDDSDAALGRATRELFAAKAWKDASTALDFLGHRAMGAAQGPASWPATDGTDDVAFARAAGAMVARRWLDEPSSGLTEAERRRLAPIFDAAARAEAARELNVLSGAPRGTPPP